jgi:hypothetical protein
VLNGVARGGAAVPDAEFVKDRAKMGVDGAPAEKERLSDLLIRHPACHELQHLDLSRREVFEARRCRARLVELKLRRRRSFTPSGQELHPLRLRWPY